MGGTTFGMTVSVQDAADLLHREAWCLDNKRWEEWLALYADDAIFWAPAMVGDEGWTDGWCLMNAFRRKAVSLGATVVNDTVAGLELAGHRVTGVRLAGGDRLSCNHVINAAGAWAAGIAAMARSSASSANLFARLIVSIDGAAAEISPSSANTTCASS